MNLPASRCLSALAKLRWASVGLAGFALLLCAGLGCAALGWGGLSFTVLALQWAGVGCAVLGLADWCAALCQGRLSFTVLALC